MKLEKCCVCDRWHKTYRGNTKHSVYVTDNTKHVCVTLFYETLTILRKWQVTWTWNMLHMWHITWHMVLCDRLHKLVIICMWHATWDMLCMWHETYRVCDMQHETYRVCDMKNETYCVCDMKNETCCLLRYTHDSLVV